MRQDDFEEVLRIQRLMSERVMQEQRTDHKIVVLNALQDLGASKKPVQVELLLLETQSHGVGADETQNLLDDLFRDGLVSRPRGGFVSLK